MKRGVFRFISVVCVLFSLTVCAHGIRAFADGTIELTDEEQDYVNSHGPLRIGYVQDRIPISFSDENGELAGVSRYIFDRVSELSGLEFEYVPLPNGDVTYDYLLDGAFDLVSSVEYNKENQTARGILISNPYLSGKKVVVARDGLDFKFDAHLSIAISTGSQTLRKVLATAYPNFECVDYPSISACFDAVNNGEADLMMQNQYLVEHWMSKPIYEKLKVIPVLGLDDQLCFSAVVAFNGGEGPSPEDGRILINILNKAIASMSEDEVGNYTIQAIMENQYRYTISDFLYHYRYAASLIAFALLVIILLTVLLLRVHIRYTENKVDAKVKGRFLSTMSHEIRTPLNGLLGLNYLMSQKLDDPKRLGDYLRQSNMTAKYLLSLVNDMLDMSSLQSQNMELVLRPVDLDLLFGTVTSIAENAISGKGITYNVRYDLEYPYILGDEVRIQQVLLNLLDNARKFTPKGGNVTLSVSQEKKSDGRILTTAVVSDTGRGMSDEFQNHIFDLFAQELDTVSKGNQGTGLGLPISRRLALLMDGDLTFVSSKDSGSTFTFTFTSSPSEPPEDNSVDNGVSPKNMKILVVEDNELNSEIILELLSENGIETCLAENGKKALEIFSESEPGTFDVILMDLLMPEMDGFETARAIRALDRSDAQTVRIFACTANSYSDEKKKAFESGMDDFITKPVDISLLLKKINGQRN